MPEIVDDFPGKFTWRNARICWSFVWIGIIVGAGERGVDPNEALRVERERWVTGGAHGGA